MSKHTLLVLDFVLISKVLPTGVMRLTSMGLRSWLVMCVQPMGLHKKCVLP